MAKQRDFADPTGTVQAPAPEAEREALLAEIAELKAQIAALTWQARSAVRF